MTATAPFAFAISDVQRWAEFSSDFNPIHFDAASARAAGLDDLVVHGMLALLPVKHALAQQAAAQGIAQAPWLRFHALFRSPVPHGADSDLAVKPGRRGGLDFRLLAAGTEVERFRGSLAPCDNPFDGIALHDGESLASRSLLDAEAERFRAAYPALDEGWLALDAIVFSDFMRHRLGEVAQAAQAHLAQLLDGAGAVECLFVQASHAVYINTQALGCPGPLALPCGELRSAMSSPEVIANKDKVVGSVALSVTHNHDPVMLMEIGLVAKPNFQTP